MSETEHLEQPTADRAPDPDASRINPRVFYGSSVGIVLVALWAMFAPDAASDAIAAMVTWISEWFGWYYFLVATLVLVFVVYVSVSRLGRVKLGPEESKPDFSVFTWASMLFAAGIGIDLMFFSVSAPVTQYLAPPEGDGGTIEAARDGVVWTLFHYGITGWAMYALMGMALGYFAYRRGLPLSIRSALYPIIGKRVHGGAGDAVDLAAVLGTVFGIATSLGIGVVQLNYGLTVLFDVPEGPWAQTGLIVLAVFMATVSAVLGVDKGIRRLSELNVVLAIGLMGYVLFQGDTVFLLNALVLNIGDYASDFAGMTLNTFAFDRPTDWLNAWTLFFWAWWIAWAPFVGLFLARISRGRTIRQFVAGVLIIPFLFILVFISIFGNSALDLVIGGADDFGEVAMEVPEQAFYTLLAEYPGAMFVVGLATFIGLLFYVTSADSGALVTGNFTSHLGSPRADASKPVRVFWAVATGLLTLAMLLVGGVPTLQDATIIMGLPFSFVMFLVMFGLFRALRVETYLEDSHRAALPLLLSGRATPDGSEGARHWRQRLARLSRYPGESDARSFLDERARPALQEIAGELGTAGYGATVQDGDSDTPLPALVLRVDLADEQDFVYRVWPSEAPTPSFATERARAGDTHYRLEVHLGEGSQGYDLTGYTKEQVIADVLNQYERHLEYLRLGRSTPQAPVHDPDEA
jgi:choline/glycine/proline betaine transport protein